MKLILSRLFASLLVMATLSSILAVVVFVSYVLIGIFAGAQAQRQAAFLDTSGIITLFFAEACQVLSILTLITQSAMSKQIGKKSREIAVLILSLIPFMVILILLLTLVVYLNARRKPLSPERRKDLEDELKEKTLDVFIDASTNSMSSAAANIPVVRQPVSLRDLRIQHAINRIVGPTTANLSNGLLLLSIIALIMTSIAVSSGTLPSIIRATPSVPASSAGLPSGSSPLGSTPPGSSTSSTPILPSVVPPTPPNKITGSIQEFTLPIDSGSLGIVVGPDGNFWLTENLNDKIGRLSPTGILQEFTLENLSLPISITAGPDGNIWFTESLADIGRITPTGIVHNFTFSNSDLGMPEGITAGSDGNIWFTEAISDKIGRITPTGSLQEFALPKNSEPISITAGPDGNIWFTESRSGSIGRITPAGVSQEFPLPVHDDKEIGNFYEGPGGITTGPDGNIWFTEYQSHKIGRITLSGVIQEFPLPKGSGLHGIAAGPDGNIWFTEDESDKIGRITPSGAIKEFPLPNLISPLCITAGPDGNIWFTESGRNKIGRITP